MKVFRDRLALTIEASRVSQAEVARVAGMNAAHLNDILRGRREHITAEVVARLAKALGCSCDWLLGFTTLGPAPVSVRHAIALGGGRVLDRIGAKRLDPININAGVTSHRGRVRGRARAREEPDDA